MQAMVTEGNIDIKISEMNTNGHCSHIDLGGDGRESHDRQNSFHLC